MNINDIDDIEIGDECSKKLIKFLEKKGDVNYTQFPEEYKEALCKWIESWFVKRLNFIFDWSFKIIENNKTKKRTTASIIDDI